MPRPIARLTIRKDKQLTTVEIGADAGFHDFYRYYTGRGRGRKLIRKASRNDARAGLGQIAARFCNRVILITVLNKKKYAAFLSCPIDQLPGYEPVYTRVGDILRGYQERIPVQIEIRQKEHASV